MDVVDIGAHVWQDETGKFMRFSVPELGLAIQVDMLHVGTESESEDQSAIMTQMAFMLPELMGGTLERAYREWGSEE